MNPREATTFEACFLLRHCTLRDDRSSRWRHHGGSRSFLYERRAGVFLFAASSSFEPTTRRGGEEEKEVVGEEEEELEVVDDIGRRRGPWSYRLRVRVCLFGSDVLLLDATTA